MLKALLSFFGAIAIIALTASTAGAKETTAVELAPKFVSIPIYYVTDREQKGATYGNRRRYHEHCEHHMYHGTATVTIPNSKHLMINETLNNLGWQGRDSRGPKVAPKDMITPEPPRLAKQNFLHRLTMALAKESLGPGEKTPELDLFVHGAADAFEYCVEDAALMAYYMQKPMVLYSWPSDPHLRGYFIDGTNIEWSQKHFNTFCHDLLELKSEHPLEVVCLSHSMGNRLVIRALPVVYGKELIADWEIISPDIDADTCRHYMMGYNQPRAKVRLYVSNHDKILPFTQMLNGGYYRLGEAANPAWEQTKKGKSEYLERIDFSLVDRGWYGHSLPFELVANMVRHDKPEAGYTLVPEKAVKANAIARLAGRSEDMNATSYEADFCSRLVKEKK